MKKSCLAKSEESWEKWGTWEEIQPAKYEVGWKLSSTGTETWTETEYGDGNENQNIKRENF